MRQPAAVMNDPIVGNCVGHQSISPATGNPVPAPPMPFNAPITLGCATSVVIGGRPVVLEGATGTCTPPQVGLHATDPFMAPPTQMGTVVTGSVTVRIEGRGVAHMGSQTTMCFGLPGALQSSATTVLVGG